MSELPQLPPPLRGWTALARGEHENDLVARCPAGHIHLDYGNLTVRFQSDEFLAFARMVAEAAARIQGVTWPAQVARPDFKPSTIFSLN